MTGCSAVDSGVRNSLRGAVRPALFLVRESAPAYAAARSGERADALLALGDRIADLARSIQVAEAEMMRLIVEFDRRRGWAEAGFGSCAEWLAWRIGVLPNAARERVRTARALAELPLATAAMAEGRLPYAKARALTRVATPESEEALLALAEAGSALNLERVVRAWKAMDDAKELSAEQVRHRNRRFSVFVGDDGSYVVKGRLEPEVGAVLMRAVEAATDALYRREVDGEPAAGADLPSAAPSSAAEPCDVLDITAAQRRADAVGLLAERALAAGFGESGDGVAVDGECVGRGSRAERYQVLLYVEPDTLREDRPSGRSELDGVRVCRETSRRLTCDAGVARVEEKKADGVAPHVTAVTSVGRRTRTVPPVLR
ncbi:MAG: DUF222 domain-containing protein, partial [Gemmatimonadetes bacterium]|nr:DUF222 domain-containing protein [Gemmatimonadota bacterium]